MIIVPLTISSNDRSIPVLLSVQEASVPLSVNAKFEVIASNAYEGPYEVTPTTDDIVLQTSGKVAIDNIKVNRIPQNYGLITWNGTVITVS